MLRRRYSAGIAQSLRRHPVLTVRAVKVTSHHAEAVGKRSGMRVKKRLFLNRIALSSRRVPPRNVELTATIVADLADPRLTFGDGAAMSASEATHAVFVQLLVEIGTGFANVLVEDGAQSGQGRPLIHSTAARDFGPRPTKWKPGNAARRV